MKNEKLKEKYEKMHQEGQTSWFSDGEEERLMLYQLGRPWKGKKVLEIGCGEGHLAAMIAGSGAEVDAVDYSGEAINRARELYNGATFYENHYKNACQLWCKPREYDAVVMQGILEHLDSPWDELKWMRDELLKAKTGYIVTSSPCFLNPRGIVWMTLQSLFDVPMSSTDLHFLHPWEFAKFATDNKLDLQWTTCDAEWAAGPDMVRDYQQRLPKALEDKGYSTQGVEKLLMWLEAYVSNDNPQTFGATAIYKLTKK